MQFLFSCFLFHFTSFYRSTILNLSLLRNQFVESPSFPPPNPSFILNWANRFFDPYLCPRPKATNCFYSCVQTSSHPSRANISNGRKIKLSGSHSCLLRNELLGSHTISKYVVPSTLSPDCLFAHLAISLYRPLLHTPFGCCFPPTQEAEEESPSQSPFVSWPLFKLCINCNHNSQLHISLNFSENSFCKLAMPRGYSLPSPWMTFLATIPILCPTFSRGCKHFKRIIAVYKYFAVKSTLGKILCTRMHRMQE